MRLYMMIRFAVVAFVLLGCKPPQSSLSSEPRHGKENDLVPAVVLEGTSDTLAPVEVMPAPPVVPEPAVEEEPVPVDVRQAVKEIYGSQLHVREKTGNNDGVDVEKYLRYTGLGKGYAWCAAFVCWTLGEAGVDNPKSAWSPSLLPNALLIYQHGSKVYTANPQTADVFGIYFSNLKRIAHVGFIDEWPSGSYAVTVEGNTNDAGSREGDGVYRKRRLKTQIYKVANYIR